MKAIDLAKQLYPALSRLDIIQQACPDNLHIVDKIDCSKDKITVDNGCSDKWFKKWVSILSNISNAKRYEFY